MTGPLSPLQDQLGKLKATGDDGFEGLVADLLSAMTGRKFYGFSSGLQAGKDSETGGSDWGETALQCKRYKKSPSSGALVSDLSRAINDNDSMEMWVVGCVAEVHAQAARDLKKTSDREGVSVVILDSERLEALVLSYPEVSGGYGLDLSCSTNLDASRQTQLLDELRAEVNELPSVARLAEASRSYLLERMDGNNIELGRRINLSRYTAREAENDMDRWWATTSDGSLVVLGEEGMGKTTLIARWMTEAKLQVPVLWIAARDIGATSDLGALLLSALEKLEKSEDLFSSSERSRRRLQRWLRMPDLRFLAVIDGLNETSKENATRLIGQLDSKEVRAFLGRSLRVVMTCRPQRWSEMFGDGKSPNTDSLPLGGYTHDELKRALEGTGIEPQDLPEDTLALFQRPLYYAAAKEYVRNPQELSSLTKEDLCWMGIRHRVGSGSGLAQGLSVETESEALNFFASLADHQLKARLNGKLSLDAFADAAKNFLSKEASAIDLLRELSSMNLASQKRDQVELDFDHLILGQGMFLLNRCLDQVEASAPPGTDNLLDWVESFFEPDIGLEARAIEAALLFSLLESPCKELSEVRFALLLAWTRVANFNEASERAFIRLAPDCLVEYLDLADWLWKDWHSPTRFRSLLVESFVSLAKRPAELPDVLRERTARWFRLTYPPRPIQVDSAGKPSYALPRPITKAAEQAGGYPELIARIGLEVAETQSQTNLFFVSLAIFSVKPESQLFQPLVESELAGAICERSSDELYVWLAGLFLGQDFWDFLQKGPAPIEPTGLLAQGWLKFLRWSNRKVAGEAASSALTQRYRTREWLYGQLVDILQKGFVVTTHRYPARRVNSLAPGCVRLSTRLWKKVAGRPRPYRPFRKQLRLQLRKKAVERYLSLSTSFDALFRDPSISVRLRHDGIPTAILRSLCSSVIDRLAPTNEGLWRSQMQTTLTLVEEKTRALLCSQAPTQWGKLMAKHLEAVAKNPKPRFFLHDLAIFAPIARLKSIELLLHHLTSIMSASQKQSGTIDAQFQDLLCCYFLLCRDPRKALSMPVPREMPLYTYVTSVLKAIAELGFARTLIERLQQGGPRSPFELGLLYSLVDLVPFEAEEIALEEWQGKATSTVSLAVAALILARSDCARSLEALKQGWVWREEMRKDGLIPVPHRFVREAVHFTALELSQLLKIAPLDFVGVMVPDERLGEYRSILELCLADELKKPQPSLVLRSEVTLPSGRGDFGSISDVSEESGTLDLRDFGHWKGPDTTDLPSSQRLPLGGSTEEADRLTEWHKGLKEEGQGSEPFRTWWQQSGALERLVPGHLDVLTQWADELIKASAPKRRGLIARRSSFYWLLMLTLLRAAPPTGIALWKIIDGASTGIEITHWPYHLPKSLKALFAPTNCAEILQLRDSVLLAAQDDRRLHHIALAAGLGDQRWLEDWAAEQLGSSQGYRRALAARLIGWLPCEKRILERLIEVRDGDVSSQVAAIADAACEAQRHDHFARHWLKLVRNASDSAEATAAAQLFLLCGDSRAYIWRGPFDGRECFSRTNKYLEAILWERFSNTVSNQQRKMLDTFLGHKRAHLKERVVPFLDFAGNR